MRLMFGLVMLLYWGAIAGQQGWSAPLKISADTQLFVDDALIAAQEGLRREIHACEKLPAPVLVADQPWEMQPEDERVYIYGTVLRDAQTGRLRMWYNQGSNVLYATSEDGLLWEKPALDLIRLNGSKENNCLLQGMHSPSVVYNPAAPEETCYGMIAAGKFRAARGYCAAWSPDGLHWTKHPENPVLPSGDTCTLAYDAKTATYLAFHKRNVKWRGVERRTVYLATSPDMKQWSDAKLVMAPDEIDDAQVKAEGGMRAEFYNMSAFPYGDGFLGFVTLFHHIGPPKVKGPEQSSHDGPIDVQLIYSKDGRAWSRLADRSPVIPNGPHAYDAGCILGVANGVLPMGDEIWTWYTAITTTHGGALPEKKISIAVAKWRRDGFVSLNAEEGGGWLRTKPLAYAGKRLHLNAEVAALTVALLDAAGRPLPGYGHEDCQAFSGDAVRHAVCWKDKAQLPSGGPAQVEIRWREGKIYSFRIGE